MGLDLELGWGRTRCSHEVVENLEHGRCQRQRWTNELEQLHHVQDHDPRRDHSKWDLEQEAEPGVDDVSRGLDSETSNS